MLSRSETLSEIVQSCLMSSTEVVQLNMRGGGGGGGECCNSSGT